MRFYTAKNTNIIKHFISNVSERVARRGYKATFESATFYELEQMEDWQKLVFTWYSRQIAAVEKRLLRHPISFICGVTVGVAKLTHSTNYVVTVKLFSNLVRMSHFPLGIST